MSKFTKDDIKKEIEGMNSYIPVSKIEKELRMPPTTLQKVLSGERNLPKKWERVLEAYFVSKGKKTVTQYSADKFVAEVKKYPITTEKETKESMQLRVDEYKKEVEGLGVGALAKKRKEFLNKKIAELEVSIKYN